MPYYHDEAHRTVYAVPDKPMTSPRKQGKKHVGWTVWAEIEVTRADNYLKEDRQWATPTSLHPRQEYDHRDDEAAAVRFFRAAYMGVPGSKITGEEYDRLKAEYESIARSNKPPATK
jgi:hypothetical protein